MKVRIAFDETRPIYLQIVEEIKRLLASGELTPGAKIPSVRDLSQQLEVNPNTVARAYNELEREGIIFTKRGLGAFATEDIELIKKERERIIRESVEEFKNKLYSIGISEDEIKKILKEEI